MGTLTLKLVAEASVPTPATGKVAFFIDGSDVKVKLDDGTVVVIGNITGALTGLSDGAGIATTPLSGGVVEVENTGVLSVNGLTGVVTIPGTPGAVVDSLNGEVGALTLQGAGLVITTLSGGVLDIAFTETFCIACGDETTAITAGTAKTTFHMPCDFMLTEVFAGLTTPQTSGTAFTVDINEAGTSVLSTKITVDNGEETSLTAATPPVISDAALAKGAKMTFDFDAVGDGTAKGPKVYLTGYRT